MSTDATTVEISSPMRPKNSAASSSKPVLGEILALAGAFGLVAALFSARELWAVQLVLLTLLFTAPGVTLLRLLRLCSRDVAILMVPASVLVVLFSGLATDVFGGAIGLTRPLNSGPLLVGLEIVCIALLAGHAVRVRGDFTLRFSVTVPPPVRALPLVLPVAAAAGAQLLNAGHGSLLAVACVAVGVIVALALFAGGNRLTDGTIAAGIYSVALASLWSFSLRSESIFGYDVTTEFRKMGDTLNTGAWPFAHPNDAYGAMLSVTIFPVQLHHLVGVSLPLVVKLVYPALFALTPVLIFYFARQFLRGRWAVLAALIFVMQANFGFQMPQLARQEIAFLLLAGLLWVIVRRGETQRSQLVLAGLMAVGVVVTHYSTTYFSIGLLLVALLVLGVLAAFRRDPRGIIVLVVSLLVLLVGAALWNGALTRSTANVSSVLESFGTDGFQLLPRRDGGSLFSTYVTGNVTRQVSASQYQATVVDYYATNRPYVVRVPDSTSPRFMLMDVPSSGSPVAGAVVEVLGFFLRNATYLAGAVGSVLLLVRRRLPPLARVVGAMALASVVTLAVVRVSGTVALSYNQDRALLNALFVLAPAAAWSLQMLSAQVAIWLPRPLCRVLPAVIGVALAAQIGIASSLFAFFGHQGGANLASDGEDAARQYVRQGELVSARWLGQRAPLGQLVYADRYGSLRFLLATGRYDGVLQDLVPPVIDRQAWVYASTTNVRDDTVRSQTKDEFGIYRFPSQFLAENFDVVYTNGLSRIYHGLGRD